MTCCNNILSLLAILLPFSTSLPLRFASPQIHNVLTILPRVDSPGAPTAQDLSTALDSQELLPYLTPPPYIISTIRSTTLDISFFLIDPNPLAPAPDAGVNTPVRCNASFASSVDESGVMAPDWSLLPYEPQLCVNAITGQPESASLFAWQIMAYAGPGLWILRVWHRYMDTR